MEARKEKESKGKAASSSTKPPKPKEQPAATPEDTPPLQELFKSHLGAILDAEAEKELHQLAHLLE